MSSRAQALYDAYNPGAVNFQGQLVPVMLVDGGADTHYEDALEAVKIAGGESLVGRILTFEGGSDDDGSIYGDDQPEMDGDGRPEVDGDGQPEVDGDGGQPEVVSGEVDSDKGIAGEMVAADGGSVDISEFDDGKGLADEIVQPLFEPGLQDEVVDLGVDRRDEDLEPDELASDIEEFFDETFDDEPVGDES